MNVPILATSHKGITIMWTIVTVATEVRLQTVCKLDFPVLVQHRVYLSYKPIWYSECTGRVVLIDANIGLFEVVLVSFI